MSRVIFTRANLLAALTDRTEAQNQVYNIAEGEKKRGE